MAVIKKFTESKKSNTENKFVEVFLNQDYEFYLAINDYENTVCLDIETANELLEELQDIVYTAKIYSLNESNG